MTCIYVQISYESYKALEEQMRAFNETTHTTTGGFYHKSIRIEIAPDQLWEFHGPLVKEPLASAPEEELKARPVGRLVRNSDQCPECGSEDWNVLKEEIINPDTNPDRWQERGCSNCGRQWIDFGMTSGAAKVMAIKPDAK